MMLLNHSRPVAFKSTLRVDFWRFFTPYWESTLFQTRSEFAKNIIKTSFKHHQNITTSCEEYETSRKPHQNTTSDHSNIIKTSLRVKSFTSSTSSRLHPQWKFKRSNIIQNEFKHHPKWAQTSPKMRFREFKHHPKRT